MWWQYLLVFVGAMLLDITPFPLPPALTVMVLLQVEFHLNIWATIAFGVAGSLLGRYVLTLYISRVSDKIFNRRKNEDVQFLGKKLKSKGWKSQMFITVYSLMPLPTTPLFVAAGMAKLPPQFIFLAFLIGKVTSDAAAVLMGNYAVTNSLDLLHGVFTWKSVLGLTLGLMLIAAIVFINWRKLLQEKKLTVGFHVFR